MGAKDPYHKAVKRALDKEKWLVTDDPYRVEVGGAKFEIDLGAESLLATEREGAKIAVEIKTFLSDSPITDYHAALGQFLNYRLALEFKDPSRKLYLAIPAAIHGSLFQREFLHLDIKDGKIWIQNNTTEMRIAHELVEKGVPKEDIILGFQPAYARAQTDFGVA